MKRRTLLAMIAALPFASRMAWAAEASVYSPEAVAAGLAAGKTVVLDFSATWCVSCQAQGRSISALRDENPGYADRLAFFVVDWDTYKDTDLAKRYGITGRGALVLLKGDQVLTKTATHSPKADLKAMFDQAGA
jgi:thiol:disulfide interchange protein